MKEKFINKTFRKDTQEMLQEIQGILNEYAVQGYTLTVRQLYYQLVSRDIIPNSMKEYKKIVNITGDGRLTGNIDWEMIEDRGRVLRGTQSFESPSILSGLVIIATILKNGIPNPIM